MIDARRDSVEGEPLEIPRTKRSGFLFESEKLYSRFITIELCSNSLHQSPQVAMIVGKRRRNTVVQPDGMNYTAQSCPTKRQDLG
jgi:hypothetical protein